MSPLRPPYDIGTYPVVRFNLGHLMRQHRVTLRELKARTGFTLKRIRQIRAMAVVPYLVYCDYTQAVTGVNVFNLGRYRAIESQLAYANAQAAPSTLARSFP